MSFWFAIAAISIAQMYYSLQKRKLKLEHSNPSKNKAMRRQIQDLYAENEALKDRLHQIEMQLSDRDRFIDLDQQWEEKPIHRPNQGFEY